MIINYELLAMSIRIKIKQQKPKAK